MNGALSGFGGSLRLALRRDRARLPLWALGVAAFTAYCSQALRLAVPKESDLAAMASLMSGPAGVVLVGPGYGFEQPSHAAVFAGGYGLYVALLAACMSILLVLRHTRAEEESERLELLRALPLARSTPQAVALLLLLITNVTVALLSWAILVTTFDPWSSLLFACGVAMVGFVFGTAALVTAQLSAHGRTAGGGAFLALGAAFAVRGVGDVLGFAHQTAEAKGSWLSWFSPLAWAQQTRVFVADRWWPLALGLVTAAILVAVASALQSRRDLGAGIIPPRESRASAGALLAGPFGLALRVQRGSVIGWVVAALLTGVSFGALAKEVGDSLGKANDPLIVAALGGDPSRLVDGYLAVCLLFGVVLAGCFVILSVQRLAADEASGRVEAVLALPLGRVCWGLSTLVVALGGGALILVTTGAATGAATAVAVNDASQTLRLTLAGFAYVPAVAVVAGIAFLGYALRPGLVGVSWAVLGYGLFASMLGGMLKLPDAAQWFSVFHHAGQPPFIEPNAGSLVGLSAVAIALISLGCLQLRRRDLRAG